MSGTQPIELCSQFLIASAGSRYKRDTLLGRSLERLVEQILHASPLIASHGVDR